MAPGGTPDDIVNLLQGEIHRAINTPEIKDRFGKEDIWIVGSTPAETAARITAANEFGPRSSGRPA